MNGAAGDPRRARREQLGQGLVEFALIVPVLMLVLLAMLEFGFAFNHNLTLEYATREGARAGAALANGTLTQSACVDSSGTPRAFTANDVDPLIIAAVQRVLESPGSMVRMNQVSQIRIYQALSTGAETSGKVNVWTYTPGAGPYVPCQASPPRLDFTVQSTGWAASGRSNGGTVDSIGVSVSYTYQFTTPLAGLMRFLWGTGSASLPMTDRTVMALNPTN